MDPDAATRFVPVPDADGLDDWLPRPGLAGLFLHDPGCGGSLRAYREVEVVGGEVALLDVRSVPAFADEVERRTGVRHESPQAILLNDGRAVWSASHRAVTAAAITEAKAAHAHDHAAATDSPACPARVEDRGRGQKERTVDDGERTFPDDAGAPVGGSGDRLAGAGAAGAGDRRGPNAGDQPEERPGPNQHSMAGEDFATDAARNYHGRDASA